MKSDDIIAGKCLFGFIRREPPAERMRCLHRIEQAYGRSIARIVRSMMKNSGH